MSETVEWAIDYHDGTGPRVGDDEWTVCNWATYWNKHREGQRKATVVYRTVVTSEWEEVR